MIGDRIEYCYVPTYPQPWVPPAVVPSTSTWIYTDTSSLLQRIEKLEKEVKHLKKAHYATRQKEKAQ